MPVPELGLVTGQIYENNDSLNIYHSLDTHTEKILDEFKGLGVKWIRLEADWVKNIYTSPHHNDKRYQQVQDETYRKIVRKAHARGIKVLVLVSAVFGCRDDELDKVNGHIHRYVNAPDSKLNRLVNEVFVGDARVDAFEITNEPNQGKHPDFRIGGNSFAWLLRQVWQWKIDNRRPELIISGGTVHTYFDSPAEPWWQAFLNSTAWQPGLPRPFDYMGVHPYNAFSIDQNAVNVLDPNCFRQWKNTTKSLLVRLANRMNQLPNVRDTQLFVTEFGWQMPMPPATPNGPRRPRPLTNSVMTLEQVVAGMQAAFEAFRDSGVVSHALWYNYRNDWDRPINNDNDGIERFGLGGLWDANLNFYPPKLPVWQKFKQLAGGIGDDAPNSSSYWQ